MWNYLKQLIWNQEPNELSLEDTCSILKTVEENKENTNANDQLKTKDEENVIYTKLGEITKSKSNSFVIDDLYVFTSENIKFPIGSKVQFQHFTHGKIQKVLNVELVDNEWFDDTQQESLWSTRVKVCKVKEKNGRLLVLDPGGYTLNLDDTSIEFVPLVGDWLEIEVKTTVDYNSPDLEGNVVEINRASPMRPHMVTGTVTKWDENTGIINSNIFFSKNILASGYMPHLGDKIITEVIESEQNNCIWRAIKLIPNFVPKTNGKLPKKTFDAGDFIESHPHLTVEDVNLTFDKLYDTRNFSIRIKNLHENELTLLKAEFVNNNGQCNVLNGNLTNVVPVGDCLDLNCECTSKNAGVTNEILLLTFQTFQLFKTVIVSVKIQSDGNKEQLYERKYEKNQFYAAPTDFVKGRRVNVLTRFNSRKLPLFTVPQKLIDTMTKNLTPSELLDELQQVKPSIFSNLTYNNYLDKFHSLLHVEEIESMLAVRKYDQDRACFIVNGDLLMLEMDNLLESKPSIVLGDTIIATDPSGKDPLNYEGHIHKVGSKHVYLKFNERFHGNYNGEDYSVKVVQSRTSYKRLHQGIHLAMQKLGNELLFPTRIVEKDRQISFVKDADDLEWYNENLNKYQKNAVRNVLSGKARPLPYVIFGPPGTGKTVTLIEIVLQIVRSIPNSRLLITAPSNSAADLLAVRLIEKGIFKPGDLVRLLSLNYITNGNVPELIVPFSLSSYMGDMVEADKTTSLGRQRIVVSTCSMAGIMFNLPFARGHFTHFIIDEAAQCSEPTVMVPLSFLDKSNGQIILAGDPGQLGPVVLSKTAAESGLAESYVERLINRFPYVRDDDSYPDNFGYDPRLVTKLIYNYRSLPTILSLFSGLFYNNDLIATIDEKSSEESRLVAMLSDILPLETKGCLCVFFHGVYGQNYQTSDSPSWFNPHEAAQVFYYVNELYRKGVESDRIGIITPYVKQAREIKNVLVKAEFDLPKIGTIEEFQGQEFDVVLLSTVRSSQEIVSVDLIQGLGFVSNPKRLNVAISRAKAMLIIIGNPDLLSVDPYWLRVIEYCVERNCFYSS